MEHLTNCHGEWNALFAMTASLPFIGAWARHTIYNWREHDEENNSCKST